MTLHHSSYEIFNSHNFRSAQTEEYVVYGPINREPEEKLYPWKYERKESGVRKLYALLYKKLQKK